MSLIFRRQDFSPSCPLGGRWYACSSGSNFVGCCNSSPCDHGCSDGNLEPASFDTAFYGQIPDQECSAGSRWYTCAATIPPFMGCCRSNPCTNGCPSGDVTAGFLSSNPKIAAAFSPSGGSSDSSTSSSSLSTASISSSSSYIATSTQTAAPAQPLVANSRATSSHSGAIAGGAVGGILVIALVLALLMFYYKRKTASRQHMSDSRVPPNKPNPTSLDKKPRESFAHDQKQALENGNEYTIFSHILGLTSFISEPQFSTPAPGDPTSQSLLEYSFSSVEMDSSSQSRPQQSSSLGSHQTSPSSSEYWLKAPGLATSSQNRTAQSGGYIAYSPANSSLVLSPLASPVVELDGSASASPFGNSIAAQQSAMNRRCSWELDSTDSVRDSERLGQSTSPQLRQAYPSSARAESFYNRPPPPLPGGWVNR